MSMAVASTFDPPVRSAQAPAAPAFAQVYAAEAAFAWRTLRRLGVRDIETEDACQEVFLVVHRRLDEFDAARPLRAWVFGICAKVAARYRRRASVRHEQATAEPEAITPPDQARTVERRQAEVIVDRALAELGDEQRAIFILFEFEQLAMTEVATLVGCPLQTAYSRLYAARKHVERALARGRGVP